MQKRPTIKKILIEARELKIHPVAQRELIPKKLKEFKEKINLDAIGVIHCVDYPIKGLNGPWTVDGQHRIVTLVDVGMGEWKVDVWIHVDIIDDAGASELFLDLNNKSTVRPYDKFQNALTAGHPTEVGVAEIVRSHGLRISKGSGDRKIACVASLPSIYRIDGGKTLDQTLFIAIAAWGRTKDAMEASVLAGLARVIATHNGELNPAALTNKLAKRNAGATGLIADARGLKSLRKASMAQCVRELIIGCYNSGRRESRIQDKG